MELYFWRKTSKQKNWNTGLWT